MAAGLVATLVAGTASAATAGTQQLQDTNSYTKSEIQALYAAKIISGDGNGKFRPTDLMDRDEFATILVKALGLPLVYTMTIAADSDLVQSLTYVGSSVDEKVNVTSTFTKFGQIPTIQAPDMTETTGTTSETDSTSNTTK